MYLCDWLICKSKGIHCLGSADMRSQKKMYLWLFDGRYEAFGGIQSVFDKTNWHWLEFMVVATKGCFIYFSPLLGSNTMRHFPWYFLTLIYRPMRRLFGVVFWFDLWRTHLKRFKTLVFLNPDRGVIFQFSILPMVMADRGEIGCWLDATFLKILE